MAASSLELTAPSGPTAATGRPPSDEAPLDTFALLRDQVRGTFAFNRTSLAGHLVGAVLIVLILAGSVPRPLLFGWASLFAVVWLIRLYLALRYARREPTNEKRLLARLRNWQVGVLVAGSLWGAAAWLFYPFGSGPQQIALVLVVYTFSVASVPILAPQFPLFVVFVTLVFGPAIAAVAVSPVDDAWQTATLMAVAMAMIVVLGRNYRASFDSVIALKLRTEMLAEQLRAEKADADAARQLDITRIDSGGVEVNPQSFAVSDIFRKLRLHYEPTAFEKGLGLAFRGERHVALADPLLVERILRNLVSNAIRYTVDGSVLVSARRVGETIRLQVWDTGPGIDEEERMRVFEEFYQVPGTPTAALGEHKKGLGLGLAIVKRLSALMQAPISLRSRLGHGSVFTLELPVGTVPRPGQREQPGKGPTGLTLDGRLIVIVEDEPAVREGLEVLLHGWGAEIVAFESVGATRAWAEASDPKTVRPALVIADYRLEHGQTGVAAIDLLRQRFGHALPAIVVTGSSMTGHDKEALEHDFHLLIKPVLPNKLRAMIAFKLAKK